ncbi:MAG: RNA polymerase sigma factor [Planctomycetes bacterium]|nr:RNA polymerase sigma factor [Planctomycetota bacterium]
MDETSDGRLLAAWVGNDSGRGDASAFEALVARHERALLRHARALLGDWKAGEDVVQEVFLRLAQRPPTLSADVEGDPRAESAVLSSWLHQVLRNLCMDTQRSETRRRRREREAAAGEATSGGMEAVDAADTKAAVERGLLRLPEEQREVLVLRLFDDKSYAEIATITGRKVGTVGWLISIGMKALAAELAPLVGGFEESATRTSVRPVIPGVQSLQGGVS